MPPQPPPAPSAKDERLAVELARGASRAEAGRLAGVAERTVYHRLADPAFKARVGELQALLIGEAVGRLVAAAGSAVDQLAELMKTADSDAARVSAARAILKGADRREDP